MNSFSKLVNIQLKNAKKSLRSRLVAHQARDCLSGFHGRRFKNISISKTKSRVSLALNTSSSMTPWQEWGNLRVSDLRKNTLNSTKVPAHSWSHHASHNVTNRAPTFIHVYPFSSKTISTPIYRWEKSKKRNSFVVVSLYQLAPLNGCRIRLRIRLIMTVSPASNVWTTLQSWIMKCSKGVGARIKARIQFLMVIRGWKRPTGNLWTWTMRWIQMRALLLRTIPVSSGKRKSLWRKVETRAWKSWKSGLIPLEKMRSPLNPVIELTRSTQKLEHKYLRPNRLTPK